MSGRKLPALGALIRWRDLAETRATDAFRSSNDEVRRARQQSDSDSARGKAMDIQRRRGEMLSAASIDPARLQYAADIEDRAWSVAWAHRAELDAAEQARHAAQAAYVDARAQTRVVEARHARLSAIECDRQEKATFDRMADLYAATRSTPR
jgi:hypothetical protein